MNRRFPLRGLLLGLAALGLPTLAHAAPTIATKNARATVEIVGGAKVRKLRDLNFGWLAVTGGGSAIVNPNTDAMTTANGVVQAGGFAYAALFEAVSPVKAVVLIRIPRDPITVTRVGGTETMVVSNWTLSGNNRRTLASQEAYEFKVGGTLTVNANQAEGLYVGTFIVEIQYP